MKIYRWKFSKHFDLKNMSFFSKNAITFFVINRFGRAFFRSALDCPCGDDDPSRPVSGCLGHLRWLVSFGYEFVTRSWIIRFILASGPFRRDTRRLISNCKWQTSCKWRLINLSRENNKNCQSQTPPTKRNPKQACLGFLFGGVRDIWVGTVHKQTKFKQYHSCVPSK